MSFLSPKQKTLEELKEGSIHGSIYTLNPQPPEPLPPNHKDIPWRRLGDLWLRV